ncbi:MAG: hypothetical protein ABH824_03905 [Nanoarchaeota archaeon]|nr:hypothetical protein [Nanoarchaeota archaeon]MBU1631582.1 hypothetical protein [Nanoarchaeota archaeon]MBU1876122.1 hypothetical protein [Nanoarchaeota archaeon]
MIRKDKKGMMDDFFDFFFTVIIAFFILLFLNITLSGGLERSTEATYRKIGAVDAKNNLLMYLKSPVDDGNMADLIIKWYYNKENYTDKLNSDSEIVLKSLPVPHVVAGWNVRIHSMPENTEEIHIQHLDISGYYEKRNSFIELPLVEEGKYLNVEIYLECEDVSCE